MCIRDRIQTVPRYGQPLFVAFPPEKRGKKSHEKIKLFLRDLAFVFGEGVADEKHVSLKVSWIEQATIEIVKKDDTADVNLAGAVFGVYSDEACTCLLYTSRCV